MIRVDFYPSNHRITVTGHADSAEPGRDLVCCAASAYAYALQYNMEYLNDKGWMENVQIRMDPGDVVIACLPVPEKKNIVTLLFNSLCMGFFILEADYPDYVVCKVHDD